VRAEESIWVLVTWKIFIARDKIGELFINGNEHAQGRDQSGSLVQVQAVCGKVTPHTKVTSVEDSQSVHESVSQWH
jgi:hypothetical protein